MYKHGGRRAGKKTLTNSRFSRTESGFVVLCLSSTREIFIVFRDLCPGVQQPTEEGGPGRF